MLHCTLRRTTRAVLRNNVARNETAVLLSALSFYFSIYILYRTDAYPPGAHINLVLVFVNAICFEVSHAAFYSRRSNKSIKIVSFVTPARSHVLASGLREGLFYWKVIATLSRRAKTRS